MPIATYSATFNIVDRKVIESKDETAILSDLITAGSFVSAIIDGVLTILDMKRIATLSNVSIDKTLEIGPFISGTITDFIVDALRTETDIPLKDLYTRRFESRIAAADPHADANYTVQYTSIKTPDLRDSAYHQGWANDLVITSPTKDLSNTLVAVNGLFHKTALFDGELFVAGGYANMKRANATQTLVVDTTSVGGHEIVEIEESQIHAIGERPLSQGFKLSLPEGKSFKGKTAFLVFHGQLFALGNTYRIISPTLMKVYANQIDIVHLVSHHPMTKWSRKYRVPGFIYQNSEIPNPENALPDIYDDENPLYSDPLDIDGIINTTTVLSDEYITNLLTAGQTFIVLVNNANLYMKRYWLTPTAVPGHYETYKADTPRGLLMYNRTWALPFTMTSGANNQHVVNISPKKIHDDFYKTMIDQDIIDAPWFDTKNYDRILHAEIIEFYSA